MKYIIDTDPGIDDAIAIMLGYKNKLDVIGFTIASGNIPIEKTEKNIKTIEDVLKADIKIFKGTVINEIKRPTAEFAHGKDGLGNINYPESARKTETTSAEDYIIESSKKYENNLTLICLGPLTNLANAIKKDNTLVDRISRVVIMGVSYTKTKEKYKEFNVSVDPEAASFVLSQPFKNIDIITHEAGISTWIEKDYINSLKDAKDEVTRFLYKIAQKYMEFSFEHYGVVGLTTPDPTTISYVIDESIVTMRPCTVKIDVDKCYCNVHEVKKSNIKVSTEVDMDKFRKLFKETFKKE